MSDIVKKLSLNKHPSDVPNYSLIQAKNVKLSNDIRRITNEEGIIENDIIRTAISAQYGETTWSVCGVVPTSNELIIFTFATTSILNDPTYYNNCKIFRYNEGDVDAPPKCIIVNDQWKWHGGKLRGTYTYNINKHLIVQLAEDPMDEEHHSLCKPTKDTKVALKSFDFDDWDIINNKELGDCIDGKVLFVDERKVNNILDVADDTTISTRFGNRADYVNSIVPQVPTCNVTWQGLINGNAVKGIYTFFIRYKIDCWGNYTQWYSIGCPITVDSIEKQAVSRYNWYYNYSDLDDESGHSMGCVDFYSNTRDFCEFLPKIRFNFKGQYDYLNFQKYQIGIIIKRLDTTKTYRTDDFDRYIDQKLPNEYEYIFNKEKLVDISLNELTLSKYNYYNVRNTINYQNRNYIANYNETNYNVSEQEVGLFDGTNNLIEEYCTLEGFAYTPYTKQDPNDFPRDKYYEHVDTIYNEFCYDTNLIHSKSVANGKNKLNQVQSWEKVKGYDYGTWQRIVGPWSKGSHFGVPMHEVLGIDRNKKIKVGTNTDYAYKFVIYQQGGRDSFSWWNNKDARCTFGKVVGSSFQNIGNNVTVEYDDKKVNLDGNYNWMSAYHPMLDYRTSFDSRLSHKTLIPGEVYSFYLHFIDKYGHSTSGFKISNKKDFIVDGYDLNQTLGDTFAGVTEAPKDTRLSVIFDIYKNNPSKWRDYKLYQFINSAKIYKDGNAYGSYTKYNFGYYANTSGDTFHRLPFYNFTNSVGDPVPLVFGVKCKLSANFEAILQAKGYVGYYLSYEKAEPMSRVVGFASETDASEDIDDHPTNHDLDGIPNKEKFKGDYNGRGNYYRGNNNISTGGRDATNLSHKHLYVYSDDLNTSSRIKVDFNAVTFRWGQFDYRGFWQDQGTNKVAEYRANLNLPEHTSKVDPDKDNVVYPIDEYEILIGDNTNNRGKGTRVQIKNPGIFSDATKDYNAIATIWSLNNNIYTNPDKELIRINNISLFGEQTEGTNYPNTFGAYPGCITFNSTLVFRRTGARWDEQWTTVKGIDGCRYYFLGQGSYNVVSPQRLVQFPCYFHRFLESKQENNKPDQKYFILNIDNQARFDDEKDTKRIAKLPNDSLYFHGGPNVLFPGRPVMPIQTLDMYKYIFPDEVVYDKLLMAYNPNMRNITSYNKTIRRSDVIQDESYVNAWRTFQPNGYKIITENKGDIVNLVGIGLYLLAHTQHSMFMFDRSAALQTQDKDVMLSMPDAFDTKYVEVYTSDKGFAGIQDRFASIVGEFGYVFYNNDFHRLFKFDEKQIKYIDEDVRLWLEEALPDTVRFANDKYNNRLIACVRYKTHIDTLSYHNDTQTFISLHDYNFRYAYATKVNNYMIYLDNNHAMYQFNHEYDYGRFNNWLSNRNNSTFYIHRKDTNVYNSYIDIIFNDAFEVIKFLEYIRYKVKKITSYLNVEKPDNVSSPVEEELMSNVTYANRSVPAYSGDTLRIFNEYCDTLDMNIDIANNPNAYNRYKLPYFELGNWNFNYFRNNIPAHPGEPSDRLRRIYGNKLVVRFVFNNNGNDRIEFETLDCVVSKQRNVR